MEPKQQQPVTALSGQAWLESLEAVKNAFDAYQELGIDDGMSSAFYSLLDMSFSLLVGSRLDVPLTPPWKQGDIFARPGHYTGQDDD
jgi:hypothetical protein